MLDGSGNIIVTGNSYGTGSSDPDYATVKYSNAGVPAWTNLYNGPGNSNDFVRAIAVDPSGNVIITGYSFGNATNQDYATIKYSSAGLPLWTNIFNGAGNNNDFARSLAVDGNANVYVTGLKTKRRSYLIRDSKRFLENCYRKSIYLCLGKHLRFEIFF